jgi:hypothetical protein
MHCNKVIRELAVPTDDRDSAALAEHLASCHSCHEWAKRTAQLNRLWEKTRPNEPSLDTWNSVWARVASGLDSSKPREFATVDLPGAPANGSATKVDMPLVHQRATSRSRAWALPAIGLVVLAQAAAVFLVVALTWRPSAKSPSLQVTRNGNSASESGLLARAQSNLALAAPGVEIDEGRLVVIRVEGQAVKVVDLTPEGISWSVDDWYVMFNEVESMPNSVVAMKE